MRPCSRHVPDSPASASVSSRPRLRDAPLWTTADMGTVRAERAIQPLGWTIGDDVAGDLAQNRWRWKALVRDVLVERSEAMWVSGCDAIAQSIMAVIA